MPVIHVESPGLLTTVQDLGRPGYGPLGVSPSGAADPIALVLGNRLAGNPDGAAALELTLMGGTFLFPEGAVIALAGSDFCATLDGRPLAVWTAHPVRPGESVRMGATQSGARCYLCVRGGIDVPAVLGSRSTHVLSGLGGFEGRPLRKGDVLPIGPASGLLAKRTVPPAVLEQLRPRRVLRVTAGPQAAAFSKAAVRAFYRNVYRVTNDSNRMGLRLEGPPLETPHSGQMITEGVPLGAVQVPAGGCPIILFIEQQTTGGYPKIANVISADLPSVGQLRPRDEVRFELVEPDTARALIREQSELLGGILK
jgi:biotin-dependent carboxylase-like uncharacterized protein